MTLSFKWNEHKPDYMVEDVSRSQDASLSICLISLG